MMKKTLLASAVLIAFSVGANAANVNHIKDDTSFKANAYSLKNPFVFENAEDAFVVNVANKQGIDASKYASGLGIGQAGNRKGKIEIIGTTALTLGQGNGVMNAEAIHLEGTNGYGLDLYRHLELNANSVTIKSASKAKNRAAVQFRNAKSGLTINADKVSISSDYLALNAAHKGSISITGDDVTIKAPLVIRVWNGVSSSGSDHAGSNLKVEAGKLDVVGDILADGSTTIKMEDGTIKSHIFGDQGADLDLGKGTWIVAEGNYDDGDNILNSLKGNGTVDMSQVDDSIVIQETMSGQTTVKVDATKKNTLTVKGESTASVKVVTDQNADEITQKEAAAMVERMNGVQATASIEEGMYGGAITVGADGSVKTATNSIMSNVIDMASGSTLTMNRMLMNDVRKRLGNIRSAEGTHGVWARYDGGRLSGAMGLENDFHTLQFGIDTVPAADAPRFGVAFSYTQSDADMKRGGAEMDAFGLAAYATKMYDNGAFVDVIGRIAKADTDVVIDGDKKGSMDNLAVSLSAEAGWRFAMTERHYVEPQVEVTYTRVNNSDLTLGKSLSYAFDNVDSVIGRAGFAAGFTCPNDMGDVYVRASVVREFMGDATVRGGKFVHELDGGDTWFEYGIGTNFNLNKNTYVYADVERTSGGALDEDWRANIGVRYSF